MDDNVKHKGSSPLFAIFLLSLLVLFLVPYSIYKLCGASEAETHKAWVGKVRNGMHRSTSVPCIVALHSEISDRRLNVGSQDGKRKKSLLDGLRRKCTTGRHVLSPVLNTDSIARAFRI